MSGEGLDRRQFNRLAIAAMGGISAGLLAGCGGGDDKKKPKDEKTGDTKTPKETGDKTASTDGDKEMHVCRGLNSCKGKGGGADAGKNACAGQGGCATAASHECMGHNECKGQGGCGENPGANECKGKGGCHVPLQDHAYGKAREAFEKKMKDAKKEFGAAPEAK